MPLAAGKLMPVVRHDGREYLLAMELMVSIPPTDLHHSIGSIKSHRDDIARAVGWLFTGV